MVLLLFIYISSSKTTLTHSRIRHLVVIDFWFLSSLFLINSYSPAVLEQYLEEIDAIRQYSETYKNINT
jgi:hypothetical protein